MTDPTPRRGVLMVAFHFPPQKGSSGLQRTLRFVQYLRDYHFAPQVLTARAAAYGATSTDQLADIPADVPVVRACALDASRHLAVRGKYLGFTAVPDRWATWIPAAVLAGWRAVRRTRPVVLFSTYPIASAHAVGALLQRLTGLPWVADIRDPMTGPGSPATGLRHYAHRAIERAVARRASQVVFATAEARAEFLQTFPTLAPERLHVVENGFDEQDFAAAEQFNAAPLVVDATKPLVHNAVPPLVLLHSGLLSPDTRSPVPFFQALAAVLQDGCFAGRPLRVVFRASSSEAVHRPLAQQFGLGEVVQWLPGLPYREALAEMLRADALLIFQGVQHNPQIPAKIFEYCRAGRPVFGLVGLAGKTARFMREEGLPSLAPLEDALAIEPALRRFLGQLLAGTVVGMPRERSARFSRAARTAELAAILETALLERRA